MKKITVLMFITCLFGGQITFGQVVNNITIQPGNPTTNDSVFVISDFSYYGNCTVGLVNAQINQSGSVINIYPEYCGFGDSTLCNVIDTFLLGVLPIGNYTINIEYHQATVCAGSFDTIIANVDTTFQIGSLSTGSIITQDKEISVFPNPTSGFIELKSKESIKGIKLFDMTGKELRILFNNNCIDMRLLNSGFYILNIELNNGIIVTKEIIKNNAG
jgi:hypothetical protein